MTATPATDRAARGASTKRGLPPDRDVDSLLAAAVEALGGAPRAGQQEMARAVAASLGTGEHLLVQAGTGTGKSLAYLVPAVAHAVAHEEVVVVSTATLALQAQVVGRDLPALAAALAPELGREPTFALVKGRSNYVCRHKLVGGFPDEPEASLFDVPGLAVADPASAASDHPDPARGGSRAGGGPTSWLGREVARVHAWADETTSGDRDDLLPGVSDRAWRQVSVSARECLGASRCPMAQECFVEVARAAAREVDVVVTNHAFLALDAFEERPLLPEHSAVVVDEAHELADRVTSAVSVQLSATGAAAAATTAKRSAGVDASRLEVAAADLADVLESAPAGRFARGLPEVLALAVAGVRDAARAALSQLSDAASKEGEDAAARQVARAALTEVFDAGERLAELAPDGGDVAWLAVSPPGEASRGRGPTRVLHVAPLSVAGPLRDRLFGTRTAVLTSATLALGGSFDAAAGRVGLRGTGAPAWRSADVGSPFDYPRQGILYTAAHLPAPARGGASPEAMDELAELVEAAGGRTLGLFSSRRAAEEAAAAMRERLGSPVLCQGEDSVPSLVRRFAADEPTSLFGTLSLWQGVDVPGRSCSLVVLDRIPFPRPDDPLASARAEAADRAGANGFMAVSATHAALLLAQGAGRLIRSTADRGVVAVLDPRLATARYGGFLRASLPPLWPTSDPGVVRAALRRLTGSAAPQA